VVVFFKIGVRQVLEKKTCLSKNLYFSKARGPFFVRQELLGDPSCFFWRARFPQLRFCAARSIYPVLSVLLYKIIYKYMINIDFL
jgi:hypothetical protein